MAETSRKRSRKSALMPRACVEDFEIRRSDMQLQDTEAVKGILPKLKDEIEKDSDTNLNSPQMQFSVNIEVESCSEPFDNPQDSIAQIASEEEKHKEQEKSIEEFTYFLEQLEPFILDQDTVRNEVSKLMEISCSKIDKQIEVEIRNYWGKNKISIERTWEDAIIQDTLENKWKPWASFAKARLREDILAYICLICNVGWWTLYPFREHLKQHRDNVTVDIFMKPHECFLLAYEDVYLSFPPLQEITIEGNCWKCLREKSAHISLNNSCRSHLYQCEFCNLQTRHMSTCTALLQHQSTCYKYLKAKFSNLMWTEYNTSYKCHFCELQCLSEDLYNAHMTSKHLVRSDVPIAWTTPRSCPKCYEDYLIYNVHDCALKLQKHPCRYCNRNFGSKQLAIQHVDFTSNDYTCPATSCNQYFAKQCMSLEHMTLHSELYAVVYKCVFCGTDAMYPTKWHFRRHFNQHWSKEHWIREHMKKKRMAHFCYQLIVVPRKLLRDISERDYVDLTNSDTANSDDRQDSTEIGMVTQEISNNESDPSESVKEEILDTDDEEIKKEQEELEELYRNSKNMSGLNTFSYLKQDELIIKDEPMDEDGHSSNDERQEAWEQKARQQSPVNVEGICPSEGDKVVEELDDEDDIIILDTRNTFNRKLVSPKKEIMDQDGENSNNHGNATFNQEHYSVNKEKGIDENGAGPCKEKDRLEKDVSKNQEQFLKTVDISNLQTIAIKLEPLDLDDDSEVKEAEMFINNTIGRVIKTEVLQETRELNKNASLETNSKNSESLERSAVIVEKIAGILDVCAGNYEEISVKQEPSDLEDEESKIPEVIVKKSLIKIPNRIGKRKIINPIKTSRLIKKEDVDSEKKSVIKFPNRIGKRNIVSPKNSLFKKKEDDESMEIDTEKVKPLDIFKNRDIEEKNRVTEEINKNPVKEEVTEEELFFNTILSKGVVLKEVFSDDNMAIFNTRLSNLGRIGVNSKVSTSNESNSTDNDSFKSNGQDKQTNNSSRDSESSESSDSSYSEDESESDSNNCETSVKVSNISDNSEAPNTSAENDTTRVRKIYSCICGYNDIHHLWKKHIKECSKRRKNRKRINGELAPKSEEEESIILTCTKCTQPFTKLSYYLKHLTDHDFERGMCPKCGEMERSIPVLVCHMRKHIKQSFTKIKLIQDADTCISSKSDGLYQCRNCEKIVSQRDFFQHWEGHLDFDRIESPLERSDDESKSKVKRKKKSSKKQKDKIETVVIQKEQMKLNVPYALEKNTVKTLIKELTKDRLNYKECLLCKHVARRINDMKRHLVQHLLQDAIASQQAFGVLVCQICGHKEAMAHSYKEHMRCHAQMMLYKCEMCNRAFGDSSNFTKHLKIHNPSLTCNICSAKFRKKEFLDKHLMEHMTFEPMTCCERTFYTRQSYKKHLRNKHSVRMVSKGNKHECSCGAELASRKELREHLWLVHNEKKYLADCPLCGKKFRSFVGLKYHVKNKHNMKNMKYVKELFNKSIFNKPLPHVSGIVHCASSGQGIVDCSSSGQGISDCSSSGQGIADCSSSGQGIADCASSGQINILS